jgi:hypothetical protein
MREVQSGQPTPDPVKLYGPKRAQNGYRAVTLSDVQIQDVVKARVAFEKYMKAHPATENADSLFVDQLDRQRDALYRFYTSANRELQHKLDLLVATPSELDYATEVAQKIVKTRVAHDLVDLGPKASHKSETPQPQSSKPKAAKPPG